MSIHNRESLKHHLEVIFRHLDEKEIYSITHSYDGTTVHIRQPSRNMPGSALLSTESYRIAHLSVDPARGSFVSTHLEHIEDRETDTTFHPHHRWKGEKNLFVFWVEKK